MSQKKQLNSGNEDGEVGMCIIGLEDKIYNDYVNKVNANYGDMIIYNNYTDRILQDDYASYKYEYSQPFKEDSKVKLNVVNTYIENEQIKYEIIDKLNCNCVIKNELPDWYKETKNNYWMPTLFVNAEQYNDLMDKVSKSKYKSQHWNLTEEFDLHQIKIRCGNIIQFSNFIDEFSQKNNIDIVINAFTLENEQKIIYINLIELALKIVMVILVTICIISTFNTIISSLCERKEEFKILRRVGASKKHINKILICEMLYMFIRATIISIILLTPILYSIIKHIENTVVFSNLLIPFGNICAFLIIILVICVFIELLGANVLKEE